MRRAVSPMPEASTSAMWITQARRWAKARAAARPIPAAAPVTTHVLPSISMAFHPSVRLVASLVRAEPKRKLD